MSQTFDAPREQQASCERREPGALATVLALPARATAAVAWEPWLGEATIARDYGVCTSDALARPPLAMVAARQPGELWQRCALPGHAAAHAVPSSRHNTRRAACRVPRALTALTMLAAALRLPTSARSRFGSTTR